MAAAGFFTAAWIVEWANVKYADKVLGIDSLFTMFVQYEHFKEIVLALWIAAAVLTVLTIRRKGEEATGSANGLALSGLAFWPSLRLESSMCFTTPMRRECGKVRGSQ